MPYDNKYIEQVKLLLEAIPFLREQSELALKGGTAINFLYNDMPRLSVDIDLTYIHCKDRDESVSSISSALLHYEQWLKRRVTGVRVEKQMSKDNSYIIRLFVNYKNTMIKIEPSYVMRGVLYPIEYRDLSESINEQFDASMTDIPVLSYADLYAGKICAALNRQHPRDLFDIRFMLDSESLDNQLMDAFVVYLACNPRPMSELIDPNLHDISKIYDREFKNMTECNVPLDDLYQARDNLIKTIKNSLTDAHKEFLISVKKGSPSYTALSFPNLEHLPALKWKVHNVNIMDSAKHAIMLAKLEKALGGA